MGKIEWKREFAPGRKKERVCARMCVMSESAFRDTERAVSEWERVRFYESKWMREKKRLHRDKKSGSIWSKSWGYNKFEHIKGW